MEVVFDMEVSIETPVTLEVLADTFYVHYCANVHALSTPTKQIAIKLAQNYINFKR